MSKKKQNGGAELIGLLFAALLAVWFYFRKGASLVIPGISNPSVVAG